VLNLSSGETWTAIREQGAWHNGKRLVAHRPERERIELLGLESNPRALTVARPIVEHSSKVRILGSMALSIAHTAAGGLDAFCAPLPVRMFDTAASLLMLREMGGVATNLDGMPVAGLPCSLDSRSTLLCAPSAKLHASALGLLRRGS
jgi:myo-inositol-1(or 4)-monophosphatase